MLVPSGRIHIKLSVQIIEELQEAMDKDVILVSALLDTEAFHNIVKIAQS